MTDTTYNDLHEFVMEGAGWIPNNQNAQELMEQTVPGEVQMFKEVTGRDISFHRCYFKLLKYIWSQMPESFQNKIPSAKFYLWIKHLKTEYNVVFEFSDGTKLIEYQSVAFGKMSQMEFETYVKEQLPFIFENVIGIAYSGDEYDSILYDIEKQYDSFLGQL